MICALNSPYHVFFSGVLIKKNVTVQSTDKKIQTLSIYNKLQDCTDS